MFCLTPETGSDKGALEVAVAVAVGFAVGLKLPFDYLGIYE
jgi:hypothetical protein